MAVQSDRSRPVRARADGPTRVLFLDGRNDTLTLVAVRSLARAGGYDVHCITRDDPHDLRYSRQSELRREPMSTPAELLAAVRRYCELHPIDLVIPVHQPISELAIQVAAEIDEFTTLAPLPSLDTFRTLDDKWRLHELLDRLGIRNPRTILPSGPPDSVDLAALEIELSSWGVDSFLLKPTRGVSGFGIRRFDSPAEVVKAWAGEEITDLGVFMIQEYIAGSDRDISFLAHEGELIAYTVQEPFRDQAVEYRSGLGLNFFDTPELVPSIERLVAETSWSGVCNVDLRVDGETGEVHVIEINPRYWQTLLGSLAVGVNFADLHCKVSLGLPYEPPAVVEDSWLNTHAVTSYLPNIKQLRRADVVPFTKLLLREFRSDPRAEAYIVWRTARAYVSLKRSERRDPAPGVVGG